ncbi:MULTISPECIES: hypothetical protein [unclassified Spirosoma]|uniref:hypothetical protein n=1 Tax=unclassified Spirosoma TaxID=2621999 RepID=UPI001AD2C8D3|nr:MULTISPECIES: hypothetical protein [unclassified Spirosoma]MBN8826867.1 hypothetical protein [Spirosoma sp.]
MINKSFLRGSMLAVFGLLTQSAVQAQGCSDAGFCTIGALKQHAQADSAKQRVTLLLPLGLGDQSVLVFTPGLQYDRIFSARWAIQAKLTANYASGDLGSVTGLGDVFLSGTYSFPAKARWRTGLTLGAKLPLSNANLKVNGNPLPMQYQSSLGTVDLIMGLSVNSSRWQLSAGWQQPLTGSNANMFLPGSDTRPEARAYPPSNQFNRKADVLGRAAYTLLNQSRLNLNIGLLGIYHLGQDTYNDQNSRSLAITGSEGLTLNATVAGWYNLSTKIRLGFTVGMPLIVREVRPDGLTRSFVFAPEVSWSF